MSAVVATVYVPRTMGIGAGNNGVATGVATAAAPGPEPGPRPRAHRSLLPRAIGLTMHRHSKDTLPWAVVPTPTPVKAFCVRACDHRSRTSLATSPSRRQGVGCEAAFIWLSANMQASLDRLPVSRTEHLPPAGTLGPWTSSSPAGAAARVASSRSGTQRTTRFVY
jgi:hypothetical protein